MIKKKIFIVEDDPIIALHISKALTSFDYEIVGSVRSGEEALQLIPYTELDLILMDVTLLGKLDGIETVTQLATAKP
ncbi:MAG: response regulator, partial [Proteobacteria bacterium]|nr:response regulator [Pseudomonadota bacterium]